MRAPSSRKDAYIVLDNQTFGAGDTSRSLTRTWNTPIRPAPGRGWIWGAVAGRPSWRCNELNGETYWSNTGTRSLGAEPFPRCAIPRHAGFLHPQWDPLTDVYTYRVAPGFTHTGGDLTRQCLVTWDQDPRNRDWTGDSPSARCADIAGAYTCAMLMPVASGAATTRALPARGPAPWERTSRWARFQYSSSTRNMPWFLADAGAVRPVMVGGLTVASIRGERVDLYVNHALSNLGAGVVALNGTHVSTGTLVWFFLSAFYPKDYPLEQLRDKPMPLAAPTFALAWANGRAAFDAAVTSKGWAGASFGFINDLCARGFQFEMRWFGGPKPPPSDEGAPWEGLYDHVSRTLGAVAADTMDLAVDFVMLHPNCSQGWYKDGPACIKCPDRTFQEHYGQALSADPTTPHPCRGCKPCDYSCERCDPVTGSCLLLDDRCSVGGQCVKQYDSPWDGRVATANDACRRCLPVKGDAQSQAKWSVWVNGSCNDFEACSFNDACSRDGFCVGSPDACLRKGRTGRDDEDCEVCGADKCDIAKAPDGRPKGCVLTASPVSYRQVVVNHTYCLHPTRLEHGMWDAACAGSNFTYGASSEAMWVAQVAGAARKQCGCSIGGRCYAHMSHDPSNACAVCDVVADPFDWTLNPVGCNDGVSCTFDDKCVLVDAVDAATSLPVKRPACRGQPYVCPRDTGETIALQPMTCMQRSDCDGANGCLTVPRARGTTCYNISAADVCMPVSVCNGVSPSCPAVTRSVPVIAPSALTLVVLDLAKGADDAARYQLQPLVAPAADSGSPYTGVLPVAAMGWSTSCGWIEFSAGYYTVPTDTGAGQCDARKALIRSQPAPGASNRTGIMLLQLNDARYPVADGTLLQLVVRVRNTDGVERDVCYPRAIVMDASRPLTGVLTNLHPSSQDTILAPSFHYGATLAFTLSGFSEEQAASTWGGQLRYEYMVAAYPVDPRLPSYWAVRATMLGFARTAFTEFVLDATRYVVFARAYNRAGLTSEWVRGAEVTIDRTAPRVVGTVIDMGYASGPTSALTLTWEGAFVASASPIDHFEVAWGTQRGSDNVVRAFSVPGNQTSVVYNFDYRWVNGTTYYGSVRAVSRSGTNVTVTARGQSIDYTPPSGLVITGPQTSTSPRRFVTTADALRLELAFAEPESHLQAARVLVSNTSDRGPWNVHNNTLPVGVTGGVAVPLPTSDLRSGQLLYVCVALQNAALLWSLQSCQSFIVDTQLPAVPYVYALAKGQTYRNYSIRAASTPYDCIDLQWGACSSAIAGIDRYELSVTSNELGGATGRQEPYVPGPDPRAGPGFRVVLAWANQFMVTQMSFCPQSWNNSFSRSPTLPFLRGFAPGVSYWFAVRCITGIGGVGEATSPSVVFDASPPALQAAGFGSDPFNPLRYFAGTRVDGELDVRHDVNVSWSFSEPDSQLTVVEWAVGTCTPTYVAEEDVLPYTPVRQADVAIGDLRSVTLVARRMLLQSRESYCVNLRATNAAGLTSTVLGATPRRLELDAPGEAGMARALQASVASRTSMLIDFTPPEVADSMAVLDGFNVNRAGDVDYLGKCTEVSATWNGVIVDPDSPITRYQWCVASAQPPINGSEPRCDIMPWRTTTATSMRVAVPGAALDGRTVYSVVRGYNDGGMWAQAVSDGASYDCTPPVAGFVELLGAGMQPLRAAAATAPHMRPVGYNPRLLWLSDLRSLAIRIGGFSTRAAPIKSVNYTIETDVPVDGNFTAAGGLFPRLASTSMSSGVSNGFRYEMKPFKYVKRVNTRTTEELVLGSVYNGWITEHDLGCPSGRRLAGQAYRSGGACNSSSHSAIVSFECIDPDAYGYDESGFKFVSQDGCVSRFTLSVFCDDNSAYPGTLCAPNATYNRVVVRERVVVVDPLTVPRTRPFTSLSTQQFVFSSDSAWSGASLTLTPYAELTATSRPVDPPVVVCGTATEGTMASVACPAGYTVSGIKFASYGTPTGSCAAGFAISSCATWWTAFVFYQQCFGRSGCSLQASNAIFGDPCAGTRKHLSYQLVCTIPIVTTACGEANEGGVASAACPAGSIVSSVNFASYGTPSGSCGGYSTGNCHAGWSSPTAVQKACVGRTACSVTASNGVFGDPCRGKGKRLRFALSCTRPPPQASRVTSLGKFVAWSTTPDASCPSGARLDAQRYDGGESCGSGPRKSTVAFKCVGTDGVTAPRFSYDGEPTACVYAFTMYVDCAGNAAAPGSLCSPVAFQPVTTAAALNVALSWASLPNAFYEGASNTVSVTVTHEGGLSTTVTSDVSVAQDHTPPLIGGLTISAPRDEYTLSLCAVDLGDPQSGISAAYVSVITAGAPGTTTAAVGTLGVTVPTIALPAIANALSAPRSPLASQLCVELVVPKLPGTLPLRVALTLINSAGLRTTAASAPFVTAASVPAIRSVVVPPQRARFSNGGVFFFGEWWRTPFMFEVQWTPAHDPQAACCAYRVLVGSSSDVAQAVELYQPGWTETQPYFNLGGHGHYELFNATAGVEGVATTPMYRASVWLPTSDLQRVLQTQLRRGARLYVWIKAVNAINRHSVTAAARPLPLSADAFNSVLQSQADVVIIRSGEVGAGEAVKRNQAVLTDPDQITLVFNPGSADTDAFVVSVEAALFASPGLRALTDWVPMGANRTVLLTSAMAGQRFAQSNNTQFIVGAVRVTTATGSQRTYVTQDSVKPCPTAESQGALVQAILVRGGDTGLSEASVCWKSAPTFNAVGAPGSFVVGWRNLKGFTQADDMAANQWQLYVALGRQAYGQDVMPYKQVPYSDMHRVDAVLENCPTWGGDRWQPPSGPGWWWRTTPALVATVRAPLPPATVIPGVVATLRFVNKFGDFAYAITPPSTLVSQAPLGFTAYSSASFKDERATTAGASVPVTCRLFGLGCSSTSKLLVFTFGVSWTLPGGRPLLALAANGSSEAPSGLRDIEAGLSRVPTWLPLGSTDWIVPPVSVGLVQSFNLSYVVPVMGPTLPDGTVVYRLVAMVTNLGLRRVAASPPQVLDRSWPEPLSIIHPRTVARLDTVQVSWSFKSAYGGGRDMSYTLSAGTDPYNPSNLVAPFNVGNQVYFTFVDFEARVSVSTGPVYFKVRGCSAAGRCNDITSSASGMAGPMKVSLAYPIGGSVAISGAAGDSAGLSSTVAISQTACGSSAEGGAAVAACPTGSVATAVKFASYGTPTGSCATGLTGGSCRAASSAAAVGDACLGLGGCSVAATNALFGDPCPGVAKRLSFALACTSAPLFANWQQGDVVWVSFDRFNLSFVDTRATTVITHYSAVLGDGPGMSSYGSCQPSMANPARPVFACPVRLAAQPAHGARLWAAVTAFASSNIATTVVAGSPVTIDSTSPADFDVVVLDQIVPLSSASSSDDASVTVSGIAVSASSDPDSGIARYELQLRRGGPSGPVILAWLRLSLLGPVDAAVAGDRSLTRVSFVVPKFIPESTTDPLTAVVTRPFAPLSREAFSCTNASVFGEAVLTLYPYSELTYSLTSRVTSLGKFVAWSTTPDASCPSGDRLDAQRYDGGESCGFALRKSTVAFKCVGTDGVTAPRLRFDGEPTACVYALTMYVDCAGNAAAPGSLCAPAVNPPNMSGLPLGAVYVGVRAVNTVGLSTETRSDVPLYVDTTAPTAAAALVADGFNPLVDVDFITPRTANAGFTQLGAAPPLLLGYNLSAAALATATAAIDVWVSWSGFAEPESWIEHYLVGLGTSPAGPNVAPMRRTTGFSNHVFPRVPAMPGVKLHSFVQAVNVLGLRSAVVASDGATFDQTPPAVAPWVAAVRDASFRLQGKAVLANLSEWAFVFQELPYDTSGDAQLLEASRPLMTAGIAPASPAATHGGASCLLSNFPFQTTVAKSMLLPQPTDGVWSHVTHVAELGNGTLMGTACSPGAYRTPFGPCLPCPPGAFKPAAGDQACSVCPPDSLDALAAAGRLTLFASRAVVSTAASGAEACRCLDATQVFNATSRECVCAAGFVPADNQLDVLEAWRGNGELLDDMCVKVTGQEFKSAPGDSRLLVKPCPVGTQPNADGTSCVCPVDVQVFDPVAMRCLCSPGRFAVAAPSAATVVNCTECPPNTYKSGPGDALAQCRACPWGTVHNRTRSGCIPSDIVLGAVMMPGDAPPQLTCPPSTIFEPLVDFNNSARCTACPAGAVQPLYIPVTFGATRSPVVCGACPGLLEGSYFASAIPTLYLDWGGVFDDGAGSGVAYYEIAVGSVVGGSQVVPFTRFAKAVTTAVLENVTFNPGAPLFLTVVAVDAAGNVGVHEDARPVFIDTSAPLAGLVLDGVLEGFRPRVTVAASEIEARRSLVAAGESALNNLVNNSQTSRDEGRITSLYDLVNATRRRMLGSMGVELLGDFELAALDASTPASRADRLVPRRALTVAGATAVTAFRWTLAGSTAALAADLSGAVPFPLKLTTGGFSQAGAAWTAQPQLVDGFTVTFKIDASAMTHSATPSPRALGNDANYASGCGKVREVLPGSTSLDIWRRDVILGSGASNVVPFGSGRSYVYLLDLGPNFQLGATWEANTCDRPGNSPLPSRVYVGEGCPTMGGAAEFRQLLDSNVGTSASGRCAQLCTTAWFKTTCKDYGGYVRFEVKQRYYYLVVQAQGGSDTGSFHLNTFRLSALTTTPTPATQPGSHATPGEGVVFVLLPSSETGAPLGAGGDGLGYVGLPANSWGVRFDARDGATLRSTLGLVSGGRWTASAGELAMPPCLVWHRAGGFVASLTYSAPTLLVAVRAADDASCAYSTSVAVDLPALLGCARARDCMAYAGFTAATGSFTRSEYKLAAFAWSNAVPTPSSSTRSSAAGWDYVDSAHALGGVGDHLASGDQHARGVIRNLQISASLKLLQVGPVGSTVPAEAAGNLARGVGAVAFATDVLTGYAAHKIVHLIDGLYGNPNSWIGASAGSFAGVTLPTASYVDSLAWGRDNVGSFTNRWLGTYTVEYTARWPVVTAAATTGDPSSSWAVLGTVTYASSDAAARRRVYSIRPTLMTGLRIRAFKGACIDEIEVFASLKLLQVGPVGATAPAEAAGNLARGVGAVAFATDVLTGYAAHKIVHLIDGLYGNPNSWIGASAGSFAGVTLPTASYVDSLAWGRDNVGSFTNRWLGTYTVEYTARWPVVTAAATTGDPSSSWAVLGTVTYASRDAAARRRVYSIQPTLMTGLRIRAFDGACIDEIEVFGTAVTPSITASATVTPSNTPTASVTPSNTPTASVTPSNTPPASVTPSNTASASVTASNTASISETASFSVPRSFSPTRSHTGSIPSSRTQTASPTGSPTMLTASPTSTASPSMTPAAWALVSGAAFTSGDARAPFPLRLTSSARNQLGAAWVSAPLSPVEWNVKFVFELPRDAPTASQTVCGTANEGGVATATCPAGHVARWVLFGSYGNPSGSCDSGFARGGCQAGSSYTVVRNACLNQGSCSVAATNAQFGDPCGRTAKRLYFSLVCESVSAVTTMACASAAEGSTATVACPAGYTINSVPFASYGTSSGDCNSGFTHGGCRAGSSEAVVRNACLGRSSCSVVASNGVFGGDPCGYTAKRLSMAVVCSLAPLGHGLTLTLQRDSRAAAAVGNVLGGGLGYLGIRNSAMVRFDALGADGTTFTPTFGYESGANPAAMAASAQFAPVATAERWGNQPSGRGTMVSVTYSYAAKTLAVSAYALDVAAWKARGAKLTEWAPDAAAGSAAAAQSFSASGVDWLAPLGCDAAAPRACFAHFGFTAATGAGGDYGTVLVHGFSYLNALGTPTPTGTPTPLATTSTTATSTPSVTATATPASQDQLTVAGDERITLDCPGDANNCSVSLNVCRSAVANVKAQYATFALGRVHGCAIDAAGDVRCFGNNTFGQAPPLPLTGPWRHVAVTDRCSCGLLNSGALRCWGATRSPGCPASYPGTYRHFAMSPLGFLMLLRADLSVDCVGNELHAGCGARYDPARAFMQVAAAGAASCALAAPELGVGGLDGGDAYCYGLPDVAVRAGPFGALVGVGASAFCGLLAFNPDNPAAAGRLDCWGPGAAALLRNGTAAVLSAAFRGLSGSYHDPVAYAIARQTGRSASYDGEYDPTRGCAGARCACQPGTALCRKRAADAAPAYPLAQALQTTGLASPARVTCGLTCAFGVNCYGPDDGNPVRSFIPGWLLSPCAVAVPMDVNAPPGAANQRCNVPTSISASFQRLVARSDGLCNVRGWWNNNTLFMNQVGDAVSLWPQAARFGSFDYAARLDDGEVGMFLGAGGVSGPAGGLMVPDYADPGTPKLSGTFSDDCARLTLSDGTRFDVVRRCAVRYVRLTRGAALSPAVAAAFPAAPASGGQPALTLSGVEVYDEGGALVSGTARLSASSVAPGFSLGGATDMVASTVFSTLPAYAGVGGSGGPLDPHGWLQLDLGREVYLSRVLVRVAAAASIPASAPLAAQPQSVLDALLVGVTVLGFDDASYMPATPPLTLGALSPAWRLTVALGADLAANPSRYEWRNLSVSCGYDVRTSASPSPTPSNSATASTSPTPSRTASNTPSDTPPRSVSASRSRSASGTASSTRSASTTPTGSPTASVAPTGSATPTATPSVIAEDWEERTLSPEEAEQIGLGNSSAGLAPYDWRTDQSLRVLANAPDDDFQAVTDSFALAWEPFEDVGSGVARVAVCLGSSQFLCDVMPWRVLESVKAHVDHAVLSELNLTAGVAVYATVAAVNRVGLVSMSSSDGVFVDDRAPRIPAVYDTGKYFLHPQAAPGAGTVLYRPPVDVNCDVAAAGVGAAWRGTTAPTGVREYAWAVGTAPNGTDILPWTPLGEAVAVFNSTLAVPVGVTYYASVRATGKNGKVGFASSDGVLVIGDEDAGAVMACLPALSRANSTAEDEGAYDALRALPPQTVTYAAESAPA